MLTSLLRTLRGPNLEVFKFGMYILFPIGWMYYFGMNLEDRFSVTGFWPSAAQSHRIPIEREEIREEVKRIAERGKERREKEQTERKRRMLEEASMVVRGRRRDDEGEETI